MYWWLYPSRIVWFILLPIYLACTWMSDEAFQFFGQASNFIRGEAFWMGFVGLNLFALAAWATEPRFYRKNPVHLLAPDVLNRVLLILYGITIATNLLFLFPVLLQPQLVVELASGSLYAMYDLRDTLNQIPGVTSLVSLQSLCVALHFSYKRLTGRDIPKKYHTLLVSVAVLCLLRSWLWSERLAALELVMPAVVCLFAVPTEKKRTWLIFAPLLGFLGLFFVFSIGEYFRTWQYYQTTSSMSFFEFISIRFAGYYATSVNNGASIYSFLNPVYEPINTAQWFYKLPIWPLFDIKFDGNLFFSSDDWFAFLKYRGNAEYNNPSGLFMPYYDFGALLGLFVWVALGALSGLFFKGFVLRQFFGQIFYPVWFIGILEILRIFYWGNTRFFPVILIATFLTLYFNKKVREPTKPVS